MSVRLQLMHPNDLRNIFSDEHPLASPFAENPPTASVALESADGSLNSFAEPGGEPYYAMLEQLEIIPLTPSRREKAPNSSPAPDQKLAVSTISGAQVAQSLEAILAMEPSPRKSPPLMISEYGDCVVHLRFDCVRVAHAVPFLREVVPLDPNDSKSKEARIDLVNRYFANRQKRDFIMLYVEVSSEDPFIEDFLKTFTDYSWHVFAVGRAGLSAFLAENSDLDPDIPEGLPAGDIGDAEPPRGMERADIMYLGDPGQKTISALEELLSLSPYAPDPDDGSDEPIR